MCGRRSGRPRSAQTEAGCAHCGRAVGSKEMPLRSLGATSHAVTPRELSVLRSLSLGHRVAEISEDLGLGDETVRSHIKKAQTKLGVRNTVQAVAQAMRLRLIP